MFNQPVYPPFHEIIDPELAPYNIKLLLKREDLIHPTISGNKWRKLKYNLLEAKAQGHNTLLSFGGAYSNHIHALAAAGKENGFKTIGIIRGEAHEELNYTLRFAQDKGMDLHYISRSAYRVKNQPVFLNTLEKQFGNFYLIPEGGTNLLAVKGCAEIIEEINIPYHYVCTPSGTGGTLAGLVAGSAGEKEILGFSALKGGGFLEKEVRDLVHGFTQMDYQNWQLITSYHFGGYAKISPQLVDFINSFEVKHQVKLDPVYTGKMMFGIYEMVKAGFFPAGSIIVALHTGGVQGWEGMRERFGN